MDKNKMEEIIKTITNSFASKSKEETNERIKDTLKLLNESNYKITNPEDFECFIGYKVRNCMKAISRATYNSANVENVDMVDFIYTNYRFLEGNIRELCVLREGSCCCVDKSRHIINMYLKYCITGKIPTFNPNIEKYYIPNFGSNLMWIAYCNSLYNLYHGYNSDYIKLYDELLKCEIRKFKHILYSWYIELKHGEKIKIYHTWDNPDKNQLTFLDKGDYYIVHKRAIVGMNLDFEAYKPTDEENRIIYSNYVKIPKSKVKQIVKLEEEKMI